MWKYAITANSWQLFSRSKSRAGRASLASLLVSRAYMIWNGYWPATVNNQANQSRSRSSRFYESMSELGDNRDEVIIHTPFPTTGLHSLVYTTRSTCKNVFDMKISLWFTFTEPHYLICLRSIKMIARVKGSIYATEFVYLIDKDEWRLYLLHIFPRYFLLSFFIDEPIAH